MRQGKVKWYNGKKCYGFVSPMDGSEDVFVHSTALRDADIRFLNENDIVEFDTEDRNGKLSVKTIKLIQRDEESAKKFRERSQGGFGGEGRGPRREGGFRGGDRRGPGRDRGEGGDKKSPFSFWKK
ncbi:MAG: cold shock domain-containing protein [Rickettsiales bacterium]|jgi:CspA family cold shock protein|nr:cold shock domain-containing protein [Rickettsiales bacterium]